MLCSICEKVLRLLPVLSDEAEAGQTGEELGASLETLAKGVKEGCYICASLWKGVRWDDYEADFKDDLSLDELSLQTLTYALHCDRANEYHPDIFELYVNLTIGISFLTENVRVSKLYVLHQISGNWDSTVSGT